MTPQAVGAYGEKVVEAELLRCGWLPSNVNASVKNAADYDILAHRSGKPVVRLRVKTCGPGIDAFQFVTPRGEVEGLDFTILVRMGKDRAADEFYVLPTSILRKEIAARETDYMKQLKKDGSVRKNTGHWTLRLRSRQDGRAEGGYGLAEKWREYLDGWPLLEGAN
jgi:hypothetical protein